MANRRMFAKSLVQSSKFLRMPVSSRLLYYDIGMNADDDGYCEWYPVLQMSGAKEQDLQVLQANGFIKIFDNDVLIVINWKENNLIKNDRYTPSKYLIKLPWNQLGTQTEPQYSIGKDSIGKDISTEINSEVRVFSLKEEIKKLEDNARRDLNVIALFLEKRTPDIKTYEQFKVVLKRHLRPAKDLVPFSNEQILKACNTAEREYPNKWTIETLVKLVTK